MGRQRLLVWGLALLICALAAVNGQDRSPLNLLSSIQRAASLGAFPPNDDTASADSPASDSSYQMCMPPSTCVLKSDCSTTPGLPCASDSVCCLVPSNSSEIKSKEFQSTNGSDLSDMMRSVSGSQGFVNSFRRQEQFGERLPNSQFQDTRKDDLRADASKERSDFRDFGESRYPIFYPVQRDFDRRPYSGGRDYDGYRGREDYGRGYDKAGGDSYGPRPYGGAQPAGYPNNKRAGYGNSVHENFGNFDHVYGSKFGYFAPDFYGPRFDLRLLSPPARSVLHKFRFSETCGIKRSDLFSTLPPGRSSHGPPPRPFGPPPPFPVQPHHSAAKLGEHPWQAAVLGFSPQGYGLRCSGTLVHPQLVVTSGNCLEGIVEPELKILLGVSDLLTPVPFLPTIERPVARIFVHEKFNQASLAHDVALLLLAKPVDLVLTPHVSPVCLPRQNQTFVATNCYIVSWSKSGPRGPSPAPYSNEIRISDMTFIASKAECQKKLSAYAGQLSPDQLTDEMHCIKGLTPTSCMGSAGGSLFCDVDTAASCTDSQCIGTKSSYLAGILTWSNQKCGDEGLAVITELSPYVPWIEDLLSSAGGLKKFNPERLGNLARFDGPDGVPPYGGLGYGAPQYGTPQYGGPGYGTPQYGGPGYGIPAF